MAKEISQETTKRQNVQWFLFPIVLLTIGLGWKFPLVGLSVPAVMTVCVIGGLVSGRYVCGNLCPRGSFFDRIVGPVSVKAKIPAFFLNMSFRWILLSAMVGFMIFQIMQKPGDLRHWGHVFWQICTVTTSIGLVLGLTIHPRSWCSFCPMGSIQRTLANKSRPLMINSERCRECKTCEKACPFSLPILEYKEQGIMDHPDCLKCPDCIAACSNNSLSWPSLKRLSSHQDVA